MITQALRLRMPAVRLNSATLYGVLCIAAGAAIGTLAWNDSLLCLSIAAMIPFFWAQSPNRVFATLTMLAYYLAAERGMPYSTSVFFGLHEPKYYGFLFWLFSSSVLALPWAALWPKQPTAKAFAWRLPLALLLVAVPPLGLWGWASPITAAGVLFPKWGFAGLAVLLALMWVSCLARDVNRIVIAGIVFAALLGFQSRTGEPVAIWKAVDTKLGGDTSEGARMFFRSYTVNTDMLYKTRSLPANSITVYPESILGIWTDQTYGLWREQERQFAARNTTVLAGVANYPVKGSQKYDNVIVSIGADPGIKYVQRVPIPVSMWKPFSEKGANAHWFGDGIFTVQGHRVAGVVCYEQLLLWPVLISAAHDPKAFIAVSNNWWSKQTSVPTIQRTTMRAWSRLFDIPLMMAINY